MARQSTPLWNQPRSRHSVLPAQTRLQPNARPPLTMASPAVNYLLVLVFLADLFTPFLIWKGLLPDVFRWASDAGTLALVVILLVRMLVFDRFPLGFWLIMALTLIGVTQATFQGQDILSSIWGVWKTFQFPLLGVYAFLNPHWPEKFSEKLRWACIAILAFEVLVQIGQYLTGEPVGDNLAGTFGRKGVSHLLLFSAVTVSYALGYGAVKGDWRIFLGTFGLGIVSSVLAENKIFPVATLLLAAVAVLVYLYMGGNFGKLIPYGAVLFVGLVLFFIGYNLFVPSAERRPLQDYFDTETRESYNTRVRSSDSSVTDYNIGRTFAMQFGWHFITTFPDETVFFLGLGLGARTESTTLGAGGIAFELDGLGLTRGTGMLVLLQEMGLLGVFTVGLFVIWLSYFLLVDLKRYPQSDANELRAAILLFTVLWPLWLWYKPVIWARIAMMLYWVSVGYVIQRRYSDEAQQERVGVKPYALFPRT
ncbi:MAG TPA: hypothetical protein P5121_39585 [Caldilineaceae bacterium]|nr:hypothetical protein [Caldilineaceae bacterium]